MRSCLVLAVVVLGAAGQSPDDPYRDSVAAMEASIARQQESVARQLTIARPLSTSFFHASWPMGSAVPVIPSAVARTSAATAELLAASDECAPIPSSELQAYVEQVSVREGLGPDLLRAVIQQESAFYPCAVSRKGAQGLMQIMPETGAELGLDDPFDPLENIDAGARFLGQLLLRYSGDVALALAAYNAGPSAVDQYEGLPPIPETLDYVSAIMEGLQVSPLAAHIAPTQVVGWDPIAPLNVGDE